MFTFTITTKHILVAALLAALVIGLTACTGSIKATEATWQIKTIEKEVPPHE